MTSHAHRPLAVPQLGGLPWLGALLALGLVLLMPLRLASATTSPTPERVLVVYNSAWPSDTQGVGISDSQQVAEYYAARRGVPAAHLLGLSCSTGALYYYYTNQWTAFQDEVIAPIQAKLTALGPTTIDVILLCYGVPYTVTTTGNADISVDNVLMGLNAWSADGSNVNWSGNPYFDAAPGFDATPGHFDHALDAFNATTMYLVCRLDGPGGAAGAMELVDQAAYADTYLTTTAVAGAYQGGIYVDSRDGQNGGSTPDTDAYLAAETAVQVGDYSSYGSADECMAWAEHAALGSGLPLHWENTTNAIQIGQPGATYSDGTSALSAPNAILYGGWYNYGTYHDVFGWLPGSVACDLNSDSLDQSTLRSPSSGVFGVSALARGASCVCGVLNEPYLTGHQRPNVLLYYLLQGYCFAEAATLSTPTIAWQDVNIGDPLYAPFRAKPVNIDTTPPLLDAGYPQVVMGGTALDRTIQLMVAQPQPEIAQASVDVGPTTAYGTTVTSGEGFWRRPALTLSGLSAGHIYHYRVHLSDPVGNTSTTGDLTFTVPTSAGTAPILASPAQAAPSTITTGSCAVSVLGADAAGEASLEYHWSILGWSPAPIAVTPNGSHAASQATITFGALGTYLLRATIINPSGLTVTSDLTVTVTSLGSTSPGTTGSTGSTGTTGTATSSSGGTGSTTGTATGSGSTTTSGSGSGTTAATAGSDTGGGSSGGHCGLGMGLSVLILGGWSWRHRRRRAPRGDRRPADPTSTSAH